MPHTCKFMGLLIVAGLLWGGGASWAFSGSLLDATDQTDPAWLVAEAPVAPAAVSAEPTLKQKSLYSPGVALSLALVPGIALHGSGHFYAGRPWTGVALLLAEAGGIYMGYRGGKDVYAVVDSLDFDKFSNFHGDTGQISNGLGLALGGVMIFLSSWLYDITGAPIAAQQANAAAAQSKAASSAPVVTSRVTAHGFEVAIERRF
ncbi:MAG: hypothetical protein HGA76_04235 [Candidatus Firestonebacteria bacterium]|nr:hypothetical protein [Candidatus Firestonebacteria bacterium]